MHTLSYSEATLHTNFSREHEPILTIESGETVEYIGLPDAGGQIYSPEKHTLVHPAFFDPDRMKGHALIGPVYIREARPGDVLEVAINAVEVAEMGWNFGGGTSGWPHFARLGVADADHKVWWSLDADAGTATHPDGWQVALDPFLGVLGMPPADPGAHSTTPPYSTGGNIDCKELMPGSTLYLPVAVAGGLFSAGDGHARQGDGEAGGTAIECPMRRAELTLTIRKDMHISTPRALTPAGWLTFGFHEDLDEAMYVALNAMLDLMTEQLDLSRKDALSLASLVVDLRITQVVNGVQGVHAVFDPATVTR